MLDVVVDAGKTHSSVLKEYQQDAVRGYITHVDLQEVRLDQPIHATVAAALDRRAGRRQGGRRPHAGHDHLNVEALPLEVPEHLEVDISELASATRRASRR